MSIAIKTVGSSGVEIDVLDTLTADDYRRFRKLTDEWIEKFGRINMLVVAKQWISQLPEQ